MVSTMKVMKLLLQVIVYNLWRERNARIFRGTSMTPPAFFQVIDRAMRGFCLFLQRLLLLLLLLYFSFIFVSSLLIVNFTLSFCCNKWFSTYYVKLKKLV